MYEFYAYYTRYILSVKVIGKADGSLEQRLAGFLIKHLLYNKLTARTTSIDEGLEG
jgi:hypothetical protein